MGILRFLDRIQSEGRARFVGFSFHDDLTVFKEIVDSYDWKLCQIQYNYYDEHAQAGKEGLQYAAAKGHGDGHHGARPGGHARGPGPRRGEGPLGFGGYEEAPGRMGPALGMEPPRGLHCP